MLSVNRKNFFVEFYTHVDKIELFRKVNNMMIILSFLIFIELIVALLLSKGDFFRPSVVLSTVMLLSSLSAEYLSFIWKFELEFTTLLIYVTSVLIIIIVDNGLFLSRKIIHKKSQIVFIQTYLILDIIAISIGFVTIVWHFFYLRQTFGNGAWLLLAAQYRRNVVWDSLEKAIPSGLARLIKWCEYFAYIYAYIIINNIVAKKKEDKLRILQIVPIILYCFDSLLLGARGYIIYVAIACVVYFYVLNQRKNGWRFRDAKKYVKRIGIIFVVLAAAFIIYGSFIGKKDEGGIIYKLSVYLGGGIGLFNDFVQVGGEPSPGFGAVTFVNMNKFLARYISIPDYSRFYQFEFRYDWGNIYTAVRRYYQDFGFIGVVICMIILSYVFSIIYYRIRKDYSKHIFDIKLLVYGIMARSLFLFFIDDELFVDFFVPSSLNDILKMWLITYILTGIKFGKTVIKFRNPFSNKKSNNESYVPIV